MKIGAYQFMVTKDMKSNMEIIEKAIMLASHENVILLVFPECALTGYPPYDITQSSSINVNDLSLAFDHLQNMVNEYGLPIIVGSVTRQNDKYYDSAVVFVPNGQKVIYNKRALWGWDKENFSVGSNDGIVTIQGMRVGIRICFEVRFPEFFRELYKEHTDLNLILFYDVSDYDNIERYELIKSHIRTRAVENITDTLTVNTAAFYQTAPTAFYDKSGHAFVELKRNEEGFLIYDIENTKLSFGEEGRKEISDRLLRKSI